MNISSLTHLFIGVLLDGDNRFDFDDRLCNRLDNQSHTEETDTFHLDQDDEEEEMRLFEADEEHLQCLREANLKNYADTVPTVLENSHYVEMVDSDGKRKVFKKSSVVWLFDKEVRKQSNDRSIRVRQQTTASGSHDNQNGCVQRTTIRPGDWCVFEQDDCEGFLLGRVLFLSLLSGTKCDRLKPINEWDETMRNVGAQCIWYTFRYDGTILSPKATQSPVFAHGLYSCGMYRCSIPPPTEFFENEVQISNDTLRELNAFLASLHQ